MKDCVHFAPMIGARPGELSAEEARALEAHLAACPRCRAFAAEVAATEGLVGESLQARANARDFAPFVDGVMARISARPEPVEGRAGPWAWFRRHRRAAAATLAPVLAALAVLVYVEIHGGGAPTQVASLEINAEGEATTILETTDGPVVLLDSEFGS